MGENCNPIEYTNCKSSLGLMYETMLITKISYMFISAQRYLTGLHNYHGRKYGKSWEPDK